MDMYSGCYIQNMDIYILDFGNLGTNVANGSVRIPMDARRIPSDWVCAHFNTFETQIDWLPCYSYFPVWQMAAFF